MSEADWKAFHERTRPRPYDLSDPAEVARLLREVVGYMRTSLHHGTDTDGRRHALTALQQIERDGWRLSAPPKAEG